MKTKTRPMTPHALLQEDVTTRDGTLAVQRTQLSLIESLKTAKLRSQQAPPVLGIAWWVQQPANGYIHDYQTQPIRLGYPVPVEQLVCVTFTARPQRRGGLLGGDWGLDVAERWLHGECFGYEADLTDAHCTRYDAELPALQDQLAFGVVNEPTVLIAPIAGRVSIRKLPRYTDVFVERSTAMRIPSSTPYTLLVRSNERVEKGQPLASTETDGLVGIGRVRGPSHNLRDRYRPPVLPASRERLMQRVNSWMDQLQQHLLGGPLTSLPVEKLLPQLVVRVDAAKFTDLDLDMQDLLERNAFRRELLDAVGPDGDFAIRATTTGELTEMEQVDPTVFRFKIGGRPCTLPVVCKKHMHKKYGEVVQINDVLAEFTSRLAQDWSAFAGYVEHELYWIAKQYLRHRARVTSDGAAYLPYAWYAGDHLPGPVMVDFAGMGEYLDHVSGWIVPPLTLLPTQVDALSRGRMTVRLR